MKSRGTLQVSVNCTQGDVEHVGFRFEIDHNGRDEEGRKESEDAVRSMLSAGPKKVGTIGEAEDKLGKFNPDVDENPLEKAKKLRKKHVEKHGDTDVRPQGNARTQRLAGKDGI